MSKDNSIHIPLWFIEKYADFLRTLSLADLKAIEDGKKAIQFTVSSKTTTKRLDASTNVGADNPEQIAHLTRLKERLYEMTSREEGMILLEQECPTRDNLASLAKLIDLPVSKRDTRDHLKAKVIDTTIGFRLRSQAIRGK